MTQDTPGCPKRIRIIHAHKQASCPLHSVRHDNIVPILHVSEIHYPHSEPIACKWCGSIDIKKYGLREGVQEYLCLKCGRKFIEKDAPYMKQTTSELIGTSISSYYDGLSFADIARHLAESGNPVHETTVYRWVLSYAEKAVKVLESYNPKVSDTWVADETVIKL